MLMRRSARARRHSAVLKKYQNRSQDRIVSPAPAATVCPCRRVRRSA